MNRIGDSLDCTGTNKEIIVAFSKCAVEFVVIGGLAVAWYCSARQADDMDLLVSPSPENSERIFQALSSLELTGFNQSSFSKFGLRVSFKGRYYSDLLTPRKDGPTYLDVAESAVKGKIFNVPAYIASARSLIQLKEIAVASAENSKQKHLNDIECLRQYLV